MQRFLRKILADAGEWKYISENPAKGVRRPVDDNLWTPLRLGELVREPSHDALKVFGRLAPGATLREAQAEAALVAARATASFPDRYAQLTPQVLPYANSFISLPLGWGIESDLVIHI